MAPTKWSLVPKSVVSVTIGRCGNFPSLEDKIPEDKILGTARLIGQEIARQGTEVMGEVGSG